MSKNVALTLEIVKVADGDPHIIHRIRCGFSIDACSFVRSAKQGGSIPDTLNGHLSTWKSDGLSTQIERLFGRIQEEEKSSWQISDALINDLKTLSQALASKNAILLFPVYRTRVPKNTITPTACFLDDHTGLVPIPDLISSAIRDSHIISMEPSSTKNHGDITNCKQRCMIECQAGNSAGVMAHQGETILESDTGCQSAVVREACLGQMIAEEMVTWFRRLRCDLNLLRFHQEVVGEAFEKVALENPSNYPFGKDWAIDIIHKTASQVEGGPPSLIAPALDDLDVNDERHPIQQAGRNICNMRGVKYTPSRVICDTFWAPVRPVYNALSRHAQAIPLDKEVTRSSHVIWGALVNLYINHGGRHIQKLHHDDMHTEIDRIVGSVIPMGRWEYAWGRRSDITDVPLETRHDYDIVLLKDGDLGEVGEVQKQGGGAIRLRLHDLRELAKSKKGGIISEWDKHELRYDGRDGTAYLLIHLPHWTPESGYVYNIDFCRMWSHLPPILAADEDATRSWSLWKAFGTNAINTSKGQSVYIGLTRVKIGQLSDTQSTLLMDATVLEEAHSFAVEKILYMASIICCQETDEPRHESLLHILQSSRSPEEAEACIITEFGIETWRKAIKTLDEEVDIHLEFDIEPFGGNVPAAVCVSRSVRYIMAYMGHIVSTNGKYTKRGSSTTKRVPKKGGKRDGTGSIRSRKRKYIQVCVEMHANGTN